MIDSMVVVATVFAATNTVLLVVVLLSKLKTHRALMDALDEATAWEKARHDQVWGILEVVRDFAASARDNRVETAEAVKSVKATVIEAPDKIAAKVVEKQAESDRDWRGREHEKH